MTEIDEINGKLITSKDELSGSDDEDEVSWDAGNLEENLERLLEKYAHIGSDIETGKNGDELDNDDDTDYYSVRLEKRRPPFELVIAPPTILETSENKLEVSPKVSQKVNLNSPMTRRAAPNDDLETSLIEMGKGLNETAGSVSSRLSKADLNKIYTELNDIHQRLFVRIGFCLLGGIKNR